MADCGFFFIGILIGANACELFWRLVIDLLFVFLFVFFCFFFFAVFWSCLSFVSLFVCFC